MSFRNVASGLNTVSAFEFASSPLNFIGRGGETITVKMRGQTPAAHADAILGHYKFTKTDEAKFKKLYGFDLRQDLTDAYTRKDNKAAHSALGKGLYQVEIPIPKELLAQIRAVKSANQPQEPKQTVAEKNGYDASNLLRNRLENQLPNPQPIPQPAPTPVNPNATPAEKELYKAVDVMRAELTNFGYRGIQVENVRADYLRSIKDTSDEILEMVKSGQISPEEGASRASKMRNVIVELNRGKDSELGRAIAESLKKEGKTLDELLETYSGKRFKQTFSVLPQAEKDAVFLDVVMAAGRDRSSVSKLAPLLGKAGKVCLVASLAISVYNISTADDKLDALGRESAGLGGGILGGAAGGAAAGLICGPGAPLCSGIGIFVGGAIGAFAASGGYDWLTSK